MRSGWNADALARRLAEWRPGARVVCFDRIESTNDKALELLEAGEPEGTLVVADEQTRGRGRRGRSWHSPAGLGLYVSFVLRPSLAPADAPLVSLTLAVAVAEAIVGLGCDKVRLKWPNDILIGSRKVGGILAEARGDPGRTGLIAGLGLNVNHTAGDFPEELAGNSTSLRLSTGHSWDRMRWLSDLLSRFEQGYGALQRRGAGEMLATFERLMSFTRGAGVRIESGGEVRQGRFAGLGSAGELLLDTGSGKILSCRFGDVQCARMR